MKRKMGIVSVLWLVVYSTFAADNTWKKNGEEWMSWFSEPVADYWSLGALPGASDTAKVYPYGSKATTARVYIPENSNVSLAGLSIGSSGDQTEVAVRPGTTLTVSGSITDAGTTAERILTVDGASVSANAFHIGRGGSTMFSVFATNGATLQVAQQTAGWVGPADIHVDDSTYAVTNNDWTISNGHMTRLYGRKATILASKALKFGVNGKNYPGEINLTDGSLLTCAEFSMGSGALCALRLTNSTFRTVSANATNKMKINPDKGYGAEEGHTNVIELVGTSSMVHTGTVEIVNNLDFRLGKGSSFALTTPTTAESFSSTLEAGSRQTFEIAGTLTVTNTANTGYGELIFAGPGEVSFRQTDGLVRAEALSVYQVTSSPFTYELRGGVLDLCGQFHNVGQRTGLLTNGNPAPRFILQGANQEFRTCMVGHYSATPANVQQQIVFVYDQTGFNPIKQKSHYQSVYSIACGLMTLKLDGGLQLLHTNVVELVRAPAGVTNVAGSRETNQYAAPNTNLWVSGPTQDARGFIVGKFADMGMYGSELLPAAEVATGVDLGIGVASGWIRLPKFKDSHRRLRVRLNLVPQGGVTLDALVAGFTAAGYPAEKLTDAACNVVLTVPAERIRRNVTSEIVAFDFGEYPDAASCIAQSPTVRALVTRAETEIEGEGLMLLIR